jgi:hypothetical protein
LFLNPGTCVLLLVGPAMMLFELFSVIIRSFVGCSTFVCCLHPSLHSTPLTYLRSPNAHRSIKRHSGCQDQAARQDCRREERLLRDLRGLLQGRVDEGGKPPLFVCLCGVDLENKRGVFIRGHDMPKLQKNI